MRSEIVSTRRPTVLRLAGFLCIAAGAIAAGIGATREWVTIGFPGDVEGTLDVAVNGIDEWEGKVVLLGAGAALVALIAMRLSSSGPRRRALAALLIVFGLACTVLSTFVALRAEDRYGDADALVAAAVAANADLPADVIREQFAEEFERSLRVDVEPWPWVAAGGGVLLMAGGVLGIAWARQRAAASASPPHVEPPEPGSEP